MSIQHQPVPLEAAEQQYLELFPDAFPENAATPLATAAHYRWKFRSASLAAPAAEFGAYEDGQMVGYYAALPYPYSLGGRTLLAAMVCDVMTHSRMRGKGVFTALGRYATDSMAQAGRQLATGFVVRPPVLPGHLKVGWKVAALLPVYLKLLDPSTLLGEHGLRWLGAAARPLLAAYQFGCRAARALPRGKAAISVEDLSPGEFFSLPGYPEFFARWAGQYPNHLLKSEAFLRWRLGAPAADYRILTLRRGGDLAAVAITRRTPLKGLDVAAVLDLMIPRHDLDLVAAVHDALAGQARRSGAGGVAMMTTRADAARWQLLRHGYWKIPYQFKFILKWLAREPEPACLWDPAAWHLMWVDSDNL